MNLKRKNLNKSKTKIIEPTKTSLHPNSKFQILTSDNRGITLIALVITIIVMLILVTVTIQVATQGNLFKHAGNSVKSTKNAVLQENYVGEGKIQVAGERFDSIDEYVITQTVEILSNKAVEKGQEVYFYSVPSEKFYVLFDSATN